MGLLTIGAFARASRLTPKALRLYDELGLLPPARVDPASGYRFYEREQLGRARLVAWLRRLGMPLAEIRVVCELDSVAAADQVSAYWSRVEAETEARRCLAAFLVEHLSGKDAPMSDHSATLGLRYAVRTDRGLVRESNQDRAHADDRLLAVADGFGPSGDEASEIAIRALTALDTATPATDLLNVLDDAVRQAGSAIGEYVAEDAARHGGGTTVTALLWSGSQLGLVHVGDSRVYLLRDGRLFQITHDHTVVQSLIDDGKLTEDEAVTHPQRAILLRAVQGGTAVAPDLQLREAQAGDRYLLCSDGLWRVVSADSLSAVLTAAADPDDAVARLIDLATAAGGPDNISCVVADVVTG